jgi:hypothetical protein
MVLDKFYFKEKQGKSSRVFFIIQGDLQLLKIILENILWY